MKLYSDEMLDNAESFAKDEGIHYIQDKIVENFGKKAIIDMFLTDMENFEIFDANDIEDYNNPEIPDDNV